MASFTGAEGELAINTTNDSAHVHDGSTAGGHELARADFNNISASATLTLGTLNTTNLDLTNLEVTNIKAKDGTAAGSIADSTGVVTLTSALLTTADITTLKIGSTTVTATATELNHVDGVTSAIQTQIDAKAPLASPNFTGGATITVADNSAVLTLKSTDADANSGPELALTRDSSSPADDDFTGIISFNADDDGGNVTRFALIRSQIKDASDGSEDGSMDIKTMVGGSERSRVVFGSAETNFNEGGVDLDFRVESDGSTHALFVQASDGNVGFNKSSPAMGIDLVAANNSQLRIDSSDTNDTTLFFDYNGGGATNRIRLRNAAGAFAINVDNTNEAMRIDSSGNIQFAGVSSNTTVLSLNTSDGSDSKQLSLAGGGADSDGRGARIRLMGNEHASLGGDCDISTGNASGAQLDLRATGSQIFTTASVEHMKLDGSVVINEGGADLDVRIESTGFANQFMLDAGNNAIGIGRVPSSMVLDLESASSGTLNAFRIRNSGTAAAAAVKQHFSLNRSGSAVDFECASIVVGKEQEWTTTASTVDGFMAFHTIKDEVTHERMRINSTGRLLGFTTANKEPADTPEDSNSFVLGPGYIFLQRDDTVSVDQVTFGKNGSVAGRITTTSSTNYTATSDYRKKENITPVVEGLERVQKLNPVSYTWIDDEVKVVEEGFIAHEVQEAGWTTGISGEKDGEDVQSMDYGRITPLLVKAIQEQQELIEILQKKVAELEGSS